VNGTQMRDETGTARLVERNGTVYEVDTSGITTS
jgi:hypothetical protein